MPPVRDQALPSHRRLSRSKGPSSLPIDPNLPSKRSSGFRDEGSGHLAPRPDPTARSVLIAGVDEAGRGPWAGPVVAAAVILRHQPLPVRIDDSKRLTPLARMRAYRAIVSCAEVGIGLACAAEIDQHNILRATLLAMQRAIEDLPRRPGLLLIDGTAGPSVGIPCRTIVHGDQRNYAISCASIVAKVVRDRLMSFYHDLYPVYAFRQHKGYGTAAHAARLRAWGPCLLHRRTFRPVREVCDEAAGAARW